MSDPFLMMLGFFLVSTPLTWFCGHAFGAASAWREALKLLAEECGDDEAVARKFPERPTR